MSNTKLPALPPHPAIRDGITWRDDERKAIDEYARAAILADRERQAGEAVAQDAFAKALSIRTAQGWTLTGKAVPVLYTDAINGEQVCRDDLWICTTAALASLPAPQEAQAGQMYDAIKQVLEHHRLTHTMEDEDGGFPLVDMLCPPDSKNVALGMDEIVFICDAIFNEVLCKQPAAPVAQPATEQAEAPRNIIWDAKHPDYPVEWSNPGRAAREGEVHYIRYDLYSDAVHAAQPTASNAGERRWPFAETPGEFASRLRTALYQFDMDILAAVRNVLIENPPALASKPAEPVAPPAGEALRALIHGMSVSVDVSTNDETAGHRYMGTVTEVMDDLGDKHGLTLLVQDAEPNFSATTPAPAGQDKEDAERWRTASRSRHHGIVVFNQFGQGWVYDQKAVEVVDATRAARGDEVNQK